MPKTFLPLTPKIVLVVVAHPDDIEFCFGGSVASWSSQGTEVHYLILTDGSNGTEETSDSTQVTAVRRAEQQKAADILGAKSVSFATHKDGSLENNHDVRRDIVRAIRALKPDTVLTFDPTLIYSVDSGIINHPDHRVAGQAALDAVFPYARNAPSFPELLTEGLTPHIVRTVLLSNYDVQNYYVDITDTINQKLEAFAAHVSQAADVNAFTPKLRASAATLGEKIGVEYAEGFVRIDIE